MRRPAAFLVAFAALAAGCGEQVATQHFVSRPDLRPPVVNVTTLTPAAAPGYVFVAPKAEAPQAGPMIVDGRGQLVWFRPLDTKGVADFRAQTYRGRPVLTWWRGRADQGVGHGYDVIADPSYRQIARVRAGNGLLADIHEFLITPRDTALLTIYHQVGKVLEGVVQEVEIPSGRVLFQWESLDHVGVGESYYPRGRPGEPWDYFHINSVEEDADGNFLVSARNTHALYKIDRATGRVLWRLGGRKSDFAMGPGTRFAWQHDARWRGPGVISLFDNEAAPAYAKRSRGLFLHVDETSRRVELLRAYPSPDGLLSGSQGNLQVLPDGHLFIGWGANPWFTELARDGRVLLDASFSAGADSYRAYKLPWRGRPQQPPALAVRTDRRGRVTAYASWNGATDAARWQVLADGRRVASVAKQGFETSIDLGYLLARTVVVRALDARGNVLGVSRATRRPSR